MAPGMENFKTSFNGRSITLTKSIFMGYLHEHQDDIGLLKLVQRQTSKGLKSEELQKEIDDNDFMLSSDKRNNLKKSDTNSSIKKENLLENIKSNLIKLGFDVSDDILLSKAKEEFFRLYNPLIIEKNGKEKTCTELEVKNEIEFFVKQAEKIATANNISPNIVAPILLANKITGVDHDSLLKILSLSANVKIGLNTDIKGKTNLFSFGVEGWLSVIKNFGHKYGLKIFADQIISYETDIGIKKLRAKSPIILEEILMMRDNINIATIMVAEEMITNKQNLSKVIDNVNTTELFLAHYLGLYDAIFFLDTLKNNPDKDISKMFKKLSTSYPAIVYNEKQKPRKLSEAYDIINLIATG